MKKEFFVLTCCWLALIFIVARCGAEAKAVSVTKCKILQSQPTLFYGEMCPWEKGYLSVGMTKKSSVAENTEVKGEPKPETDEREQNIVACVTIENTCEFQ